MNSDSGRVIYDHWSYMTLLAVLEVVFITLCEETRIDSLGVVIREKNSEKRTLTRTR